MGDPREKLFIDYDTKVILAVAAAIIVIIMALPWIVKFGMMYLDYVFSR